MDRTIKCYAIIDDIDADLAELRWYTDQHGYPKRRGTSLYRTVLERTLGRKLRPGCVPDHINGVRLDCRRRNLREATISQNTENRSKADARSTTGYRNVCRNSETGTFSAHVQKDGKTYTKGMFHTAEEAAWVAMHMRKELGMRDEATPKVPKPQSITPKFDGRSINRNSRSGYRGVTFHKGAKKWLAQFTHGGKKNPQWVYGGLHDTPEQAAKAAARLRSEHGVK